MHCVKKVTDDLYWIGGSDRRLALFENVYPIPRGVSYNSYVLLDEKTVLLDTVDASISGLFFENLEYVLNGRTLDYLIVNHMEPDHCAVIGDVVRRYPDVKLVCNAKTVPMLKQFFNFPVEDRTVIVKEMDTLCTGSCRKRSGCGTGSSDRRKYRYNGQGRYRRYTERRWYRE